MTSLSTYGLLTTNPNEGREQTMHNSREAQMLREARLRKGYTQQQLAALVDTQLRQYQRLEYGEREMKDTTMNRLVRFRYGPLHTGDGAGPGAYTFG